jgi:transposase
MMKQQGMKIYQIAEALGKSERTIHYYLSEPSRARKNREFKSKLDPFKPYIDTILEDDPTFNRKVLLRKLKKQKYNGGISILRDYAAKKAADVVRKAVIRFETEPGYQAQVDWKILNTQMVDGKRQKLYAFTMIFGYSRAPFVIHTTSMDQATVLICHVLAFHYFGGVPQEILYDNMKTAFIYDGMNEQWRPNKHLLSLAQHYGFTPRRCRVRRPQTKGKVERFIHYYENNFWIEHRGKALSLDELNEAVLSWISEINTQTIGGLNNSRKERFAHEAQFLTKLPPRPFDCRRPVQVRVSTEALVRVMSNWYSVDPSYIGQNVEYRVHPLTKETEVFYGEKLIRSFTVNLEERNQRYYLPEHRTSLHELWRKQNRPIGATKRRHPLPEVDTGSPDIFDQLFQITEVAS